MARSELPESIVFAVPGDPDQKTGGYRYVARVAAELEALGVHAPVTGLAGTFPIPDRLADTSMDAFLNSLSDGAIVILDGLAMGGMPDVIEQHAGRLRIIALVHHALADEAGLSDAEQAGLFHTERRALQHVSGVITTSTQTATRLRDYDVSSECIRVVEPGADTVAAMTPPPSATPQHAGTHLLCVGHLSPRKAQHHLVEALNQLRDLNWHCTFAGSLERNAPYAEKLCQTIQKLGLQTRITLAGELDDEALAQAYTEADLFVLPSLHEGYGMVVDEALAAGLPVITSDGGALARTLELGGVVQYPAADIEQLRERLEPLLGDPLQLQAATRAARHEARSLNRWVEAGEQFAASVQSLLSASDPTRFDNAWLTLREPADHQARNSLIQAAATAWAEQEAVPARANNTENARALAVTDLGTGTGSNGRYLIPALKVAQHWVLLEQDEVLLNAATANLGGSGATLDARACHLQTDQLHLQIPGDTRLLTASALIDLVPACWLEALADSAASIDAAVLITLSYAGDFELWPKDDNDQWIMETVNAHQHRDKGTGAAMGPDATRYLQEQLATRGYIVSIGASPWQLTSQQMPLQLALLSGWRDAAMEQSPQQGQRVATWFRKRQAQARQNTLTIRVEHEDLFARPANKGRA